MDNAKQAYPLHWPAGWPFTPRAARVRSRFGKWNAKPTVAYGVDQVLHELDLFDASDVIISTNIRLRNDGLPRSGQPEPQEVGAAVYFRKGKEDLVLACDTFDKTGCNLYAIARTVNALRQMQRDGCSTILARAFTGFKALPSKGTPSNWRSVLEVPYNCTLSNAKLAWSAKIKMYHPDNQAFADREKFEAVQQAWKDAQEELDNR